MKLPRLPSLLAKTGTVLALCLLAGCGPGEDTSTTTPDPPRAKSNVNELVWTRYLSVSNLRIEIKTQWSGSEPYDGEGAGNKRCSVNGAGGASITFGGPTSLPFDFITSYPKVVGIINSLALNDVRVSSANSSPDCTAQTSAGFDPCDEPFTTSNLSFKLDFVAETQQNKLRMKVAPMVDLLKRSAACAGSPSALGAPVEGLIDVTPESLRDSTLPKQVSLDATVPWTDGAISGTTSYSIAFDLKATPTK
jgi:hypothetical protein